MGVLGKAKRGVFRILPDSNFVNLAFSQVGYVRRFGHFANVRNPKSFNEHLMKRKCSDDMRHPLRAFTADKEFVKVYVRGKLGDGYTPEILAILRTDDEVDAFDFPERCAMKPTHGFNDVVILNGRAITPADRTCMKRWLKENYFHRGREPQYNHLEPKVMVEAFIGDGSQVPIDVKVYCVNGTAKFLEVDVGRFEDLKRDLYDMDGEPIEVEFLFPRTGRAMPFRDLLPELWRVAEDLSEGFSFVGVDMYIHDGQILVGELTSTPENCNATFNPPEGGLLLGKFFDDN